MVVPGMSDGRAFTSYQMDCVENNRLMHINDLNPSSYRAYLQANALPLMKTTLESQDRSAKNELKTILK